MLRLEQAVVGLAEADAEETADNLESNQALRYESELEHELTELLVGYVLKCHGEKLKEGTDLLELGPLDVDFFS